MAQHDYNLSNNTGALYRADNNGALQAIVTQNSGTTPPSVTFPGMLWLDLSGGGDGIMRRRNQANSAWLNDIGIDQIARDQANAATVIAQAALPRTGGTMTGPIILPGTVPTNNQAVSRAQGDALYQVMLPATQAGAMLYGAAGGWTGVLAPAANDTILALSGGLPTWTSTATVAAPNSVVRTKADGTIDATFIPSVASGLRFRGTFRPAVNAEYPTTGGSGAGGAPAVGDFWVIDGLTTGGYTFLTGTLAGVTVHNGDSIAKSDGANWYRMGSSVELDGYLRTDGSIAMEGDLNLGAHYLVEVGGIAARAGTPVPLNNFSIDASNVVISPQRGTTGADLPNMAAGRIGTDLGRMQIFVGAGASNTPLLPVTIHSTTAAYVVGEYVAQGGRLWRAAVAVSAGAFTASQWSQVVDTSGATFTGKVIIDGNIPGGHLALKNNAGANVFEFGMGSSGATDPIAFIANRAAGGIAFYANNANPAGALNTVEFAHPNQIRASGGNFVGHATSVVLAPNGAGTIYLRPNGPAASSAEWIIRSSDGSLTGAFAVNAASFVGVSSSTILANVAGSGAGAIYIRPRGPAVAAGQVVVDIGGSVQATADFYSGTGQFFSTAGSLVVGMIGTSGQIYIRPNASTTTGQAYFNTAGDLALTRNIIAANVPGSDPRLKKNIQTFTPRNLDALAMKSFFYNGATELTTGFLSPDVRDHAPEYVYTFDMLDPDSGEMVTRDGVNYANLAIEIAMNLCARVAALEAAQPQQKEPQP